MERLLSARRCDRDYRRRAPAAGMAHAICRARCRRLVSARLLAGFPLLPLRALLRARAGHRLFHCVDSGDGIFDCRLYRGAAPYLPGKFRSAPPAPLHELVAVVAAADAADLVSVR